MQPKQLVLLIAAAAALATAAFFISTGGSIPSKKRTVVVPALLLSELKDKVNDVASIEVKNPGSSFIITRTGDVWGLPSKGGYPVKVEQVKAVVVGLSELKPIEAKTATPLLYSKIGVQDPVEVTVPPSEDPDAPPPLPTAQPTRITLKDDDGDVIGDVILGTQRYGNPPSVFARRVGETQSWLAEGSIEASSDPLQWIERQVLNIPRERIMSVTVTHPDGASVTASRETPTSGFIVAGVPEGRELSAPTAPETLATGIQSFFIDDVTPLTEVSFADPSPTTVYRTFDGLIITARTSIKDARTWVNFSFSTDAPPTPPPAVNTPKAPDEQPVAPTAPEPTPEGQKPIEEVRKEADDLTASISKWAFAIPDHKAKTFRTKIEDLLKPLVAPNAPGQPSEGDPGTQLPAGFPTRPGE